LEEVLALVKQTNSVGNYKNWKNIQEVNKIQKGIVVGRNSSLFE